jgi:hypothetical protein
MWYTRVRVRVSGDTDRSPITDTVHQGYRVRVRVSTHQ